VDVIGLLHASAALITGKKPDSVSVGLPEVVWRKIFALSWNEISAPFSFIPYPSHSAGSDVSSSVLNSAAFLTFTNQKLQRSNFSKLNTHVSLGQNSECLRGI
jgi:hypothetical protein